MKRNIIMNEQIKNVAQEVLDMLEADDGKSFEVKKADIIKVLDDKLAAYEKKKEEKRNRYRAMRKERRGSFWDYGKTIYSDANIIIRKIAAEDKDGFIKVQRENTVMPTMFEKESFVGYLWEEHLVSTALMCSIIGAATDEYIGYCGIKNISSERWEIAIELLEAWKRKGIGFLSIQKLLDAASERCGVREFRVRIDSDNYASQGLFEKLGAVPNGISEFLIHDEETIRECEDENMECIDERLEAVAEKFGVEPRSLLSHVLEYKLVWEGSEE